MFRRRDIADFELPELQPYRTMRRQMDHRLAGIFVAEGEKVVHRLLESQLEVVSVMVPEKWFQVLEPVLAARPEVIDVFVAEKALLETLTGFSMYQGLLAVGKVPASLPLARIIRESTPPLLLVAVDSLSSAENIGAVVRNCAGFGVHALLVGETCTSPYLRRAVRSSMGTVFDLPILEPASLLESLRELKQAGVCCLAAHPHTPEDLLPGASLRGPTCIVFGSEGYGISPRILQECDAMAAIPMPPKVDSLNVASAAAVFLYEANRQRRWCGLPESDPNI